MMPYTVRGSQFARIGAWDCAWLCCATRPILYVGRHRRCGLRKRHTALRAWFLATAVAIAGVHALKKFADLDLSRSIYTDSASNGVARS